MAKKYRQQFIQKGFSLIELMIVVLIIGISTSMAVLYIDNSDERLKTEAQRLLAMTQFARDEAIITGESLGLVITPQQYYFTRLDKTEWLEIKNKPYRLFELSDDIQLRSLIVNKPLNNSWQSKMKEGLIYFLPTGESSEFQIWISNDNSSEFVLNSSLMGELSLKKTDD